VGHSATLKYKLHRKNEFMPKKSQNSLATNIVKYALLSVGALLTIFTFMYAHNLFSGLVILGLCWIMGLFFWYRRKAIHAWTESDVPLKQYILAKHQDDSHEHQIGSALDNQTYNHSPLNEAEIKRWSDLTESYYDDTSFEVIYKAKDKKKKKDS